MSNTFETRELLLVAGLYCEGMSIHNIAATLPDRSEEQVQQMLQKALQSGYFRYEPVLNIDSVDQEFIDSINNEVLISAISEALTDLTGLRQIPVNITLSPQNMFRHYVSGPSEGNDHYTKYLDAETESVQIVGRRAGQMLSERLLDGNEHIIGVNYGSSVHVTLKAVSRRPTEDSYKLTLVSLFGDLAFHPADSPAPLVKQPLTLACNELVTLFTGRIGPQAKAELLNVPVYIPHSFTSDDTSFKNIHKFLTNHSSYLRIFGRTQADAHSRDEDALISKIDTIITGLGSADGYTVLHRFLSAWLSGDEYNRVLDYCREGLIVGDLGGHFVTSQPSSAAVESLTGFLEKINRRLIAAKPHDFMSVASRYAMNPGKGAGVVAVATGARKARVLHALLSLPAPPISWLFIDTHCALALLHLLGSVGFADLVKKLPARILGNVKEWSPATRELIPV